MGNECQLDGSKGEVEVPVTQSWLTERRPLLDVLHNIHPKRKVRMEV